MMSQRKTTNKITLADVAKLAGVSSMTVSRVINRDSNVRAKTREKVEHAIRELNYAPNIAARSLAGGRVRRICLLYGNPSSAYLGELLLGALEAASDVGSHLIVERTSPDMDASSLESRFERDWDGIIVPPPMSDIPGIRKLVERHQFPAAFISSATEPGRANEVRIDDRQAAFDMTHYLTLKGHKRIGFIKGNSNQTVSAERFSGYQAAIHAAGLILDDKLIAQGDFSYRSGEQAAMEILAQNARPSAIFASNDDMAAGALAAAARLGLSVPQDLSVVGFDDSPIASTVWPKLTTMAQPVGQLAACAVELVLKANGSVHTPYSTCILEHKLVERGSVRQV